MMSDGHAFDSLPMVARADSSLPGSIELGAFSASLDVVDLNASRAFYAAVGFVETGGDPDGGWVIVKNAETTIGLFHGMFEGTMLTFNPGLTPRMERLEHFTDIRDVQRRFEEAGLHVDSAIEAGSTGPGSFTVTDPDGNRLLFDQFF